MKRTLFLAFALSAATALAACDKADDTTATAPNADGSVTMPSPSPENTAPATGGSGTMGGTGASGSTTAP